MNAETAKRFLNSLALFLTFALVMIESQMLIWALQFKWEEENNRMVAEQPADLPTKYQLRKAMKYHGLQMAECDSQGWYFMRDGKRCELFAEK